MTKKKTATRLFALALPLLLCACFKEKDLGYPEQITFPKEGGEMTIRGDVPFSHACIQDYKGNDGFMLPGEDSILYNEYKWLKVAYKETSFNTELKVYARPNTSSSERKLYIELYSGPEYHVVRVKQK